MTTNRLSIKSILTFSAAFLWLLVGLNADAACSHSTSNTSIISNETLTSVVDFDCVSNAASITNTNDLTDGIDALGINATIKNSGTITIHGDLAAGIYSEGVNALITNTGTIINSGIGSGGGAAIFATGDNATIVNKGLISTSGFQVTDGIIVYTPSGQKASVINSGSITTDSLSSHGIEVINTNASITNSGHISTNADVSIGITAGGGHFGGVDSSLFIDNSGQISTNGEGSYGIYAFGYHAVVNNSGTIGTLGNLGEGIVSIQDDASISNTGNISTRGSDASGIEIANGDQVVISNKGTIATVGDYSNGIKASGTLSDITNAGNITTSGSHSHGIYVGYDSHDEDPAVLFSSADTITNTGAITVSGLQAYGIYNSGFITTLNNGQGGNASSPSTTALTYKGDLPSNYNIIINSPTHYGQLMTDGSAGNTTTFNVDGGSAVTSRLYSAVLGSTIGKVEHLSGSYDNMTWTLLQHDDNYDLSFSGISRAQTQASLTASALALRGAYGLQNVSLNNNLTNDCTLFDGRGICASVTGAQHYLSGGGNNDTTSGTLTVAYRLNDQVRVGGYLDQNLNTSNVRGIHLDNGAPAFGAFAVWNANTDGLGVQVRLAAGYADKDLTVKRQAVETSEAGSGKTALSSYGASAVASYAVKSWGDSVLSPYAGIRYTKVTADAYTEAASVNVTAPLSYSALTQNATTVKLGAKWTKPIWENAALYASLGLEQDLNNNGGSYLATGVNGLTPLAFNTNINRTRPTAAIGSYYNIGDRQRIAANLVWAEQAFSADNATSLMATYTAGF